MKKSKLIFIDLFCGAGGTTTGIHNAIVGNVNVAEVLACVNHDAVAIESHFSNHKKTIHFTEDIDSYRDEAFEIMDQCSQLREFPEVC